jgi:DNA-binding CsgD family transcriptional regulator
MAITLINMAQSARNRGDVQRATALYAEGLALRWDQGDKISVVGCLRGLALVAALGRQYDRAARLFGAAERLREAIGEGDDRSDSRAEKALAPARAALGEEAFEAARAAGRAMPLSEAVALALAVPSEAGESTPVHGADRHGLTAREFEVLLLLAKGRTNPEIAETLYITTRTAQTHVQNIFGKLDISSRSEAAAYAGQHGLLA